jgi:hypothetical protein
MMQGAQRSSWFSRCTGVLQRTRLAHLHTQLDVSANLADHCCFCCCPCCFQVPLDVFKWQLAAFGGVLLLNIINLVFCANPVQYNCNVLLVLIHSVAFATDWLIEAQSTSLVLAHNGRL